MTASSPITANDLVNGLKFIDSQSQVWSIINRGTDLYYIALEDESLNTVQLSSDGLTITFGSDSNDYTFTGFTFNA